MLLVHNTLVSHAEGLAFDIARVFGIPSEAHSRLVNDRDVWKRARRVNAS